MADTKALILCAAEEMEPVKTFEKKAAPPKLYTLRFSVECEYEQMMALKRFLNENNIRYSRI